MSDMRKWILRFLCLVATLIVGFELGYAAITLESPQWNPTQRNNEVAEVEFPKPSQSEEVFKATAARISAFRAFSLIFSPSWKSIARLTRPSRLELNRPAGSSNEAP